MPGHVLRSVDEVVDAAKKLAGVDTAWILLRALERVVQPDDRHFEGGVIFTSDDDHVTCVMAAPPWVHDVVVSRRRGEGAHTRSALLDHCVWVEVNDHPPGLDVALHLSDGTAFKWGSALSDSSASFAIRHFTDTLAGLLEPGQSHHRRRSM